MRKLLFVLFVIINVLILMTQPGCKKENDIPGTWTITTTLLGETSTDTYTFKGTKGWGNVVKEGQELGNYTVAGDSVSFTLQYHSDGITSIEEYNGNFDRRDYMSGSFTYTVYNVENPPTDSGIWSGKRAGE